MNEPLWISKKAVLALHSAQLAEHGGSDGMRDETLLDSALTKPRNAFTYADQPDIFRLATSYAFEIARSHAFVDGNIRTALAVSLTFLDRNGWDITLSKEDLYLTFLHLTDGSLDEDELTVWFSSHAVPL
ncbi:MAG: type II toxin-antitoxin system death-on-curing family toxin [Edaphobacter sp.]